MKKLIVFLGLIATTAMPAHSAILSGTFTGQVSSGEEVIFPFFDPPVRRSLVGNTFVLDADIDSANFDRNNSAHIRVMGGTGPSVEGAQDPVFAFLAASYLNGVLRLSVSASGSGNDSGTTVLFANLVGGQFVNWRGSVGMGGQTGAGFVWDSQATMPSLTFVGTYAGPIPEPATWAMMIAGFGLAGAAARRAAWLGRKLSAACL